MKINKILCNTSLLIIFLLILIGTVSAGDNSDLTIDNANNVYINDIDDINNDNVIKENESSIDLDDMDSTDLADDDSNINRNDKENSNLNANDIENDNLNADDTGTPKTWTVYADKKNPNQVLNPTVQPVIDKANPGDTIILSGMFMHCHFKIEKQLTIIAKPGTSLGPCPHHNWPSYTDTFGIFYITEGGSGSSISGFEFLNNNYSIAYHEYNPFAVYVDGASNVELFNLTINWTGTNVSDSEYDVEDFIYDPIWIKNSNNVTIRDSLINHTVNGITLTNSFNVFIKNSTITMANNAGILIDDKSSNISISGNNITESLSGINMSYADNVSIVNNLIKGNKLSGVYLNGNMTQLNVLANYFISNGKHAIHYDYRLRNLNNDTGDDLKAIVDENVFSGQSDMIAHHTIYVEDDAGGDYIYNEEYDTFIYVGSGNGNYSEDKGFNYLRYALVLDGLVCGHSYITTKIPWDVNAPANKGAFNYSLTTKFVETQNGVYNFSIVDSKGNPASNLNSFQVLFYINDFDEENLNENIYKVVNLENGVANVDFSTYYEDINNVSAVLLGIDNYVFNFKGPKTWYVEPDPDNPNQVQAPTVQPIIDKANPGDTIILNGTFVHCHFMVNKTLTIIASPGTSVGVCPHHTHNMKYGTGPDTNGVFYISPEATGTVINGFSFTNDFYHIANKIYNPFGVFVEADNVTLNNLTFNWTGKPVEGSTFNPQDFIFNPIIAKDLNNLSLNGLYINNTLNAINLTNSSNVSIVNTYIANSRIQLLTGENTSNIVLENNTFVASSIKSKSIIQYNNMNTVTIDTKTDGRIGKYFTIKLVGQDGTPLANRLVQIGFNGVVYERITDKNGNAKLQINLKGAGVYTFAVAFLGDDAFEGSFVVAKITVKKQTPKLTTASASYKASAKTKTLKATIKSAKGNPIAGKKITFTVNGKTYSATTNKNGVASVKVSLSTKKTYKFTVKFAGDSTYNAKTVSSKVVIK